MFATDTRERAQKIFFSGIGTPPQKSLPLRPRSTSALSSCLHSVRLLHVAPERGGGVRYRRCRFSPCVLIFSRVHFFVGTRVFQLGRRVGSGQRPGASGRRGAGGWHSRIWQGPGVRLGSDQGWRRHGRIHGVSCDHQGPSCFLSMRVSPWSAESTCSFYLLVVLLPSYTCNTLTFSPKDRQYKSFSMCRSSQVPLAFSLSIAATLTLNGCTID